MGMILERLSRLSHGSGNGIHTSHTNLRSRDGIHGYNFVYEEINTYGLGNTDKSIYGSSASRR